jgi:hypothetical protein
MSSTLFWAIRGAMTRVNNSKKYLEYLHLLAPNIIWYIIVNVFISAT